MSCNDRGLWDDGCHCFYSFQGDDCSESFLPPNLSLLVQGTIAGVISIASMILFWLTKSKRNTRVKSMFFLIASNSLLTCIFISVDPFGIRFLLPFFLQELILACLTPLSLLVFLMSIVWWSKTRILYNGGIDAQEGGKLVLFSWGFNLLFAIVSISRAMLYSSLVLSDLMFTLLNSLTVISGLIPFLSELLILVIIHFKAKKRLSRENSFYKGFNTMTTILIFSAVCLAIQLIFFFLFVFQLPKSRNSLLLSLLGFSLSACFFSGTTILVIFGHRFGSIRRTIPTIISPPFVEGPSSVEVTMAPIRKENPPSPSTSSSGTTTHSSSSRVSTFIPYLGGPQQQGYQIAQTSPACQASASSSSNFDNKTEFEEYEEERM